MPTPDTHQKNDANSPPATDAKFDRWRSIGVAIAAVVSTTFTVYTWAAEQVTEPIAGIAFEHRLTESGQSNASGLCVLEYRVTNPGPGDITKPIQMQVRVPNSYSGDTQKFSDGLTVERVNATIEFESTNGDTLISLMPTVRGGKSRLNSGSYFGIKLVGKSHDWKPKRVEIQEEGENAFAITDTAMPTWSDPGWQIMSTIALVLSGASLGWFLCMLMLRHKSHRNEDIAQQVVECVRTSIVAAVQGTAGEIASMFTVAIEASSTMDAKDLQETDPNDLIDKQSASARSAMARKKKTPSPR